MNKTNKLQSLTCIMLIVLMVVGIAKGTSIVGRLSVSDTGSKETVAQAASSQEEVRAVWISYLEFTSAKTASMGQAKFKKYVDKMFDNCVKMKMNTVIVQVRPFGDAMYQSSVFPWSVVASGKQGRNPGYDPLEYMVQSAHKRGLKIEAWVNPYRVTLAGMKVKDLAASNPAKKWMKAKDASKRRNVLNFGGLWYYNPAKEDVRNLIVEGVKELIANYDVDGIHMDDYFYPTLGTNYKNNFDAREYKNYKKRCRQEGKSAKGIVQWRKNNVDQLLQQVYSSIKAIDDRVVFGVSPAGNINNLYGADRYYCDVKKWLSKSGYVDYICPQIYWSFTNKICPYNATVKRWSSIKKSKNVDLYIGLAAYRAGISRSEALAIGDTGWSAGKNILKKQVQAGRKNSKVSGFAFFRYDNMVSKKMKRELVNLKKIM